MLAEAAFGAFYAADAAGVAACGARVRELATEGAGDEAAFFVRMTEGMALVLGGAGEDGASSIRAAVRVLERAGEPAEPRRLFWTAMGPLWLREAGGDGELVDRALRVARERAVVGVLPTLLVHVAIGAAASDRWVEAHAAFDEAIRLARESGQRVILASALARLAWLEGRLGRAEAARSHAEEALALSRELGVSLCELWVLTALGELELALGDVDAALARLDELQAVIAARGIADPDVSPAPERVELLLRLGRDQEAAVEAEAYAVAASAKGQPWALARAARARALLVDEFEPVFAEALALHARTPDVFERARTELAFGARLRRSGERVRAREQLREALGVFDALGAAPWWELARSELAATGETARRRRDAASLDELTPQELQVALLLSAGKTTREAAAALFLSPKTIEYHLRNVYRKLGINSREALREVLA